MCKRRAYQLNFYIHEYNQRMKSKKKHLSTKGSGFELKYVKGRGMHLRWNCVGKLCGYIFHTREDTQLADDRPRKDINKKDIPDCEVQDFAAGTLFPTTSGDGPLHYRK